MTHNSYPEYFMSMLGVTHALPPSPVFSSEKITRYIEFQEKMVKVY